MRSVLGYCNIFEVLTTKAFKLSNGFPSSMTEFRSDNSMAIFKCTNSQKIENDRLCEVFQAVAIFLDFWQQKHWNCIRDSRAQLPSSELTTRCQFWNLLSFRKLKMTDCATYFRLLQYTLIFDSKNIQIVLEFFEFNNRVLNW